MYLCTRKDLTLRKIIHIDMDAFFASVEQRDNPTLKGLPLVVCHDHPRSVVTTASYEARKYGVRSAMPLSQAKKRCPHLVIVEPHFQKYKQVSQQIHRILHRYTDLVEPISLDEAFLDVTHNKEGIELAVDIAKKVKEDIFRETHLTASAGVSYNKLLAKIASDYRKPNGIFIVHPDKALDFIAELPIRKFWGIGPKTADTMHKMGIYKGEHLRKVSESHLVQVFGKMGSVLFDFSHGIDKRLVEPFRERKSVGCEQTFLEDLNTDSKVIIALYHIVIELVERINKSKFEGRTLSLKIKWDAKNQITRSITTNKILKTKDDILPLAKYLLHQTEFRQRTIRLLGLTISGDTLHKIEEGFLSFT